MSKYGNIVYHSGTYGETQLVSYSVEPMYIHVKNFGETELLWNSPSGYYSKFRLVRNQDGFPETAEDGLIVYEASSSDGSSIEGKVTTIFTDGLDNPDMVKPIEGRPIYYRVFLFREEKYWVIAGSIVDIMPENTGVIDRMINLLPRVYTSQELSPLGVVDPNSTLYKFMDALAFTYEQLLTEIKLIRPQYTVDRATYSTIPTENASLGLPTEYNLPISNQRKLIREALYLYSQRGLKSGLENYAEALTGYIPTATISQNLLLSVQDSTFYESVGRWYSEKATLTPSTDITPLYSDNVIDHQYSCKVIATDIGAMNLGADAPITRGVPVTPNTQYTAGFYMRSPTSAGSMTISVQFFDRNGVQTSALQTSTAVSANDTWKLVNITVTSDSTSYYARLQIDWDTTGTYYVDQVSMQTGDSFVYDEARAVNLNLMAKKVNYITNPSFEINSTGWSLTGTTFSQNTDVPLDGYAGTYSGQFVAAGNWSITNVNHLSVEPGNYFTFSMYCKSANITNMLMEIKIYNSNDVLQKTFSETHPVSNSWVRHSLTGLIDAFSDASYATVKFSGTAGTLLLDMVQAEHAFEATDYIDGSMPEQLGVEWAGTAHQSYSLEYPSKPIKIPKLAYTMQEWVPMNCWWRITTPAGPEFTNLTAV